MLSLQLRTSAMALIAVPILVASPTISNEASTNSPSGKIVVIKKNPPMVFKAKVIAKNDDRAKILAKFLKRQGSPMAKDAPELVRIADKYSFDWKLLPAIAALESQYGKMVPAGSFNPYGWNNGSAYFKSWVSASESVAEGIRIRYAPDGAVTPWRIGPSYAESPTWAARVDSYMSLIDQT